MQVKPHQFHLGYEEAPPLAAALVESLRGVGYSPWTAIADLIDNSISAGATTVWLDFHWDGADSWLTALDDGRGMNEASLSNAMRLGSLNPRDPRAESDLGRFGLGLKTASFSQCRRVTVASKSGDGTAQRRWDLDHIADVNAWQLLFGPHPGSEVRLRELEALPHGTVVLWEHLDRLVAGLSSGDKGRDAFYRIVGRVHEHLAMVFHRFLEGPRPSLRIYVNGRTPEHRVTPWDPFMQHEEATSQTPEEPFHTSHGNVKVKGFILPHKDRLTKSALERGAGPEGWTAQQGFYIYRARRLLVSGGWLGLGLARAWTREESFKLARIRIDIDNSNDEAWAIDVRKSTARPPEELRDRMRDLADHVRQRARKVFVHRGEYGTRAPTADLARAWKSVVDANGMTGYRIDRHHPAVLSLLDQAGSLKASIEAVLAIVERSVPVERIWLTSMEQAEASRAPVAEAARADVEPLLRATLQMLVKKDRMNLADAMTQVTRMEPFCDHPQTVSSILADITKESKGAA